MRTGVGKAAKRQNWEEYFGFFFCLFIFTAKSNFLFGVTLVGFGFVRFVLARLVLVRFILVRFVVDITFIGIISTALMIFKKPLISSTVLLLINWLPSSRCSGSDQVSYCWWSQRNPSPGFESSVRLPVPAKQFLLGLFPCLRIKILWNKSLQCLISYLRLIWRYS